MKLYMKRTVDRFCNVYSFYNTHGKFVLSGKACHAFGVRLKIIETDNYKLRQKHFLRKLLELCFLANCPFYLSKNGKFVAKVKCKKNCCFKIGEYFLKRTATDKAEFLKNDKTVLTISIHGIKPGDFLIDFKDMPDEFAAIISIFADAVYFDDLNKIKDGEKAVAT